MTCSSSGIQRQRAALALGAASLLVSLAGAARADDRPVSLDSAPTRAEQSPSSTCTPACEAQQTLATVLQEPIRIGSSRFRFGVGSSKLTVGWSLAF